MPSSTICCEDKTLRRSVPKSKTPSFRLLWNQTLTNLIRESHPTEERGNRYCIYKGTNWLQILMYACYMGCFQETLQSADIIYFTGIIWASSSREKLIYRIAAAAASISLQPRKHRGIPEGSVGRDLIYLSSPPHKLAQQHGCYSKHHRDEESDSLISERYDKNGEGNGLNLFLSS